MRSKEIRAIQRSARECMHARQRTMVLQSRAESEVALAYPRFPQSHRTTPTDIRPGNKWLPLMCVAVGSIVHAHAVRVGNTDRKPCLRHTKTSKICDLKHVPQA